ncbi:MAG: hypothetical protein OHK0039_30810 [Bacteroidia bacterium]
MPSPRPATIYLLCLLAVALPLSLRAQSPGTKAFNQAEALRKQNKFQEALLQYDEAIRLEPTNHKYYFQRGKCEASLQRPDMAIASFKTAVDYQPDFTPAYSMLAKTYKEQDDNDQAIYYYEQAVAYERDASRKMQYLLLLINLLLHEDRMADARVHIEAARNIDPSNPSILFYTAEIAASEEDWDGARRAYQKALDSDRLKDAPPAEKAKYYYGLGLALNKLGDSKGAQAAWAQANFGPYASLIAQQQLQTSHINAYKIAVSYYLNGEYDESERYADQVLAIQRDFASAYVLKGKIAAKRNQPPRAVEYYKQATQHEKDPAKQARIWLSIASLHLGSGSYRPALDAIAQAEKIYPGGAARPDLLYLRARAEYADRQYGKAIATLEQLLRTGLDTKSKAKYSFLLGMAAARAGQTAKAEEAFKNAMYGAYKPAAAVELRKLQGGE